MSSPVRAADPLDTRAAILDAALEAFAERGYDGVSVRELNRRLGMSHNLIHHHFGTKHALWKAAVEHGFARAGAMFPLPGESGDPGDAAARIELGLRRFVAFSAEHPAVHRIFEQEAALGGERLRHIVRRYFVPRIEAGLPLYEELVHVRERDLDPRSIALLVASGVTAFFRLAPVARSFGGPDPFSAEGIERHTRTITEVLMHGLAGAAKPRARKQRRRI